MIDLPLYAFAIPLIILLLTSTLLYEISDYDNSLSAVELSVAAHEIADKLVNSELVKSQEIVEGEIKTWPNIIQENLDELDEDLLVMLNETRDEVGKLIDNFQFKEALKQMMDFCRYANKYFNDKEPWNTRTSDIAKCTTTLNLCSQTSYSLAILLNPILPFSSERFCN